MAGFDSPTLTPIATIGGEQVASTRLTVAGIPMDAGADGALWVPGLRLLVVSDLHLEKGSSYARRGRFLPPYDTAATLARLEAAMARWNPQTVIALGDSFHDVEAPDRLSTAEGARLGRLAANSRWIWIAGNHDPKINHTRSAAFGGEVMAEICTGGLTFRHEPHGKTAPGEIAGHFHPKTTVHTRLARFSGRCFVTDHARLIMPAFGAFTGGLNIGDPAIRAHFPSGGFAHALIRGRIVAQSFT